MAGQDLKYPQVMLAGYIPALRWKVFEPTPRQLLVSLMLPSELLSEAQCMCTSRGANTSACQSLGVLIPFLLKLGLQRTTVTCPRQTCFPLLVPSHV